MDGVDASTLCRFVQGILSILEVGMHEYTTVWQPDICRLTLVQFLKGHPGYSGYMYSMQSGEWQQLLYLRYNGHYYDVGIEVYNNNNENKPPAG